MLPYLEQQPIYNACNFNWTISWGNGRLTTRRWSMPISPSSLPL